MVKYEDMLKASEVIAANTSELLVMLEQFKDGKIEIQDYKCLLEAFDLSCRITVAISSIEIEEK